MCIMHYEEKYRVCQLYFCTSKTTDSLPRTQDPGPSPPYPPPLTTSPFVRTDFQHMICYFRIHLLPSFNQHVAPATFHVLGVTPYVSKYERSAFKDPSLVPKSIHLNEQVFFFSFSSFFLTNKLKEKAKKNKLYY